MTKPLLPPLRTRAKIRAEAAALAGVRSLAAVDDAAGSGDAPSSDPGGAVGELWLYGVVGGWWFGFDAESVANALRGMDVDQLIVRIHSPGGYAPDGIAIGNLLRNHKATVTVVVDGLAASAASVIAIAGDEIVMCPGSQMMLHDASTLGWGNAAELRRTADWIDGQSRNYAGVYQYRAGGTVDQWRQVMLANDGDGTWYTADDAVTAGLADSVGTRIAIGSPPTAPAVDELDDDEVLARAQHDLQLLEACVPHTARAAWRGERPVPAVKATPKSPSASAVGSHPTEGGTAMAFTPEQLTTMRSTLELPETADEAAIAAAVEAVVAENLEERAQADSTTQGVPAGYVAVPEAAWNDTQTNATAGARALEQLRIRDREDFLDAHRDRFPQASRAAWQRQYDTDPEGTRTYLAEAEALVPVAELGHADNTDESEDVTESPAYTNWSK